MADMVLGSARDAVDSLLGRLTSTLTDEVKLLGGVRRDVQFIKDEMESMNGFLMHITEASSDGQVDHQVRAWMKQVGEVAYRSQNCVDLYMRRFGQREGGFRGLLRRLPRLVWTLPTRHRIATQIRELKIRAHEVGERRLRYGVQAPPPRSKVDEEQQLWKVVIDDLSIDKFTVDFEDIKRSNLAKSKLVPFGSVILHRWMTDEDPLPKRLADAGEKAEDSSPSVARHAREQATRPLIALTAHEDPHPHKAGHSGSMAHEDPALHYETAHTASTAHEDLVPHETGHPASTLAHEDPLPSETAHSAPTTHGDPLPPEVASNNGEDWGHKKHATIRHIAVLQSDSWPDPPSIIKEGFGDPHFARSCLLDYKAWIVLQPDENPSLSRLLQEILAKLAALEDQLDAVDDWNDGQLLEKLQLHLKGKKFLLVFQGISDISLLDGIKSAFTDGSGSPGSALLVTTKSQQVANSFAPHKVYEMSELRNEERHYITNAYMERAFSLVNNPEIEQQLEPVLRDIVEKLTGLTGSSEILEFFLSALYVNPNQTIENYQSLAYNLRQFLGSSYLYQVLMFAYNGLSSNCKKCLLYLSIFPELSTLRRTRLVTRWVAESMIVKTGRMSALEEADSCLNALIAHGFIMPMDTDVRSKVKKFKMDSLVHRFVTKVARNENFFETNILPVWAHHLPIRNIMELQQGVHRLDATRSKDFSNISSNSSRSDQEAMDYINAGRLFLESLSMSTQLGHMVVLDLEDCWQLKNRHLKKICKHLYNLKYLSLRNTSIRKLPKQVNKLRYLETLDIRQTIVRAFYRNSLILPKLKHLLAGQMGKHTWDNFGVQIPKHISTMQELQVLSHISGTGDELIQIGNLLKLRKLGIVLNECQEPIFRHLYHAIEKLSQCLRSLSIRDTSGNRNTLMDKDYISQDLYLAPKYLRVLKISGLEGLPRWIAKLDNLSQVTLRGTLLSVSDIQILGELKELSHLRLGQKSCSESTLTFSSGSFRSLKFLRIVCSDSRSLDITNITFASDSCNCLEKIVWSSAGSQPLSVSGIKNLELLRELDLRGNFNLEEVNKAIAANKNNPKLSIQSSYHFND